MNTRRPKSDVLYPSSKEWSAAPLKKDEAMCISGTILWCRDLLSGMKHKSLCISGREKFSGLSQRLDLISVSTDGSVFWLSVCDTVTLRIHLQNNWNCWLAIQSLSSRLLYCSLCIFPSSNLIYSLNFAAALLILWSFNGTTCFCLHQ